LVIKFCNNLLVNFVNKLHVKFIDDKLINVVDMLIKFKSVSYIGKKISVDFVDKFYM